MRCDQLKKSYYKMFISLGSSSYLFILNEKPFMFFIYLMTLYNAIQIAIDMAKTSELDQKHGAVLFRDKQIYDAKCNIDDVHAEVNSLRTVYRHFERGRYQKEG
jgi:hypothetical protein